MYGIQIDGPKIAPTVGVAQHRPISKLETPNLAWSEPESRRNTWTALSSTS